MRSPKENLPPEILNRPSLFDAVKQQLGLKLEAKEDRRRITSSTTSRNRPKISEIFPFQRS